MNDCLSLPLRQGSGGIRHTPEFRCRTREGEIMPRTKKQPEPAPPPTQANGPVPGDVLTDKVSGETVVDVG